MLTERKSFQLEMCCVTVEDLVPQGHFLRKLDAAVDFSFIYDEVRSLYCADNGRPSIDPVMLMKYLLVGYIYGIESERRIEDEIQVNLAYRWFLGLNISDRVPDHSTISQNRRRRFNGTNMYRRLFERILSMCMEKGLVEGKLILTDSTHVRANASRQSEIKAAVEKEAAWYMERLDRYEAAEREELEREGRLSPKGSGRKKTDEPAMTERTVSKTDPEAGYLQRPGKPQGMHYLDHQSVDAKNGIIVDVAVTPGNTNDVVPYLDRIEYMREHIGLPIEAVGVDGAYDVSLVHRELLEKKIEIYTPENDEEPNYKTEFRRQDFEYDQKDDTFICPAGNRLTLKRLQRGESNLSREYQAQSKDCKSCPLREKCLAPSQNSRRIQVNIFEAAFRQSHEKDGTPEHRRVLALRQIWCEGTFAAQKARHNLRRLHRRGLEAAEDHCLLSAMAVNLKRLVKGMRGNPSFVLQVGFFVQLRFLFCLSRGV
jgi:transposase